MAIVLGHGLVGAMDWGMAVSQGGLLVFLVWAAWDMGRRASQPGGLRVDGVAVGWSGAILLATGVAVGLLWAFRGDWAAREKGLEVVMMEVPEALVVLILLHAARGLRRPAGWMRLTPVLDRLAVRRRGASVGRWRLLWLLEGGAWLVGAFVFSAGWLFVASRLVGAEADASLVESVEREIRRGWAVVAVRRWVPLVLAAFSEEAIYRGYFQSRLGVFLGFLGRRWAGLVSVVVVSALWTLGHGGMIDPAWVKWVQIFGIGLVLGAVRVRLGLEGCVGVHLAFNVISALAPVHPL